MAKLSTSDYYKKNPAAAARRRIQQKAYNKNGSNKPGTKNITGREITKAANALNYKLNTYGNGDGLDASHYKGSKTEGRLLSQKENRTEPRKNGLKIRKRRYYGQSSK